MFHPPYICRGVGFVSACIRQNLATATQLLISELRYHTVQEAYIQNAETIDTAKTIHRDRNITGVQIRYRNRNKMHSTIMHNVMCD